MKTQTQTQNVSEWSADRCQRYLLGAINSNPFKSTYLDVPETPTYKAIGKRLHELGGVQLMRDSYHAVWDKSQGYAHAELSVLWHGIGGWMH